MSYKVNILFYCEKNVVAVFLCQRGQIYMLTRHVDTLVRAKHTIVHHLGNKHWTGVLNNLHVNRPVVEKKMVTYLYVTCYISI